MLAPAESPKAPGFRIVKTFCSAMADRDDDVQFGPLANRAMPALVAAAAMAVIAASLGTWVSVKIIERQVADIVLSDKAQDNRAARLQAEVNELRVELGVVRTLLDMRSKP